MKKLTFALAAGMATLAFSVPAFAQRDPGAAFDNADANRDGVVTRAEFSAERASKFDQIDRNQDGVLSKDDLARLRWAPQKARERVEALIAAADRNRDGVVTRAEFNAAPMPVFDQADTNGDGAVDKNEIAAFKARAQAARR